LLSSTGLARALQICSRFAWDLSAHFSAALLLELCVQLEFSEHRSNAAAASPFQFADERIEAMSAVEGSARVLEVEAAKKARRQCGCQFATRWVSPWDSHRICEAVYTTKENGMGMGFTISRKHRA
jgi:hypothetical protein